MNGFGGKVKFIYSLMGEPQSELTPSHIGPLLNLSIVVKNDHKVPSGLSRLAGFVSLVNLRARSIKARTACHSQVKMLEPFSGMPLHSERGYACSKGHRKLSAVKHWIGRNRNWHWKADITKKT